MTGRFLTKDPFPGLPTVPASLHPYVYAYNNSLRYTDPSGEIAPLLLAMGVGATIGGVGSGVGYAVTHPGQDYFHSSGFYQAVGVGAASGAIAGGVGFGVGALFPAGGGFAYSVGAGIVSGAAASGAGQIAANALTPCVEWHSGVRQAMFFGGFTGGLAGGAGYGIRTGREIVFSKNLRIALFGNRTGHPTGRFPHYHRRGILPSGKVRPGQGIRRHRPWDTRVPDNSNC